MSNYFISNNSFRITDSAGNANTSTNPVPVGQHIYKPFELTNNLAGTTLNNGGNLAQGATGLITLTSSTGFDADTSYVRIENEILGYNLSGVGANQINITSRGALGTSDVTHSDGTAVGELYDSGIQTLDTWSQVITKIQSDQNCSMKFIWYSDINGTNEVRSLTPSLTAGYDYLSAPAFAPYVRYTIAPSSGTTTTEMYFTTEFSRQSLHPQLFTLNSGVFGSMISLLNRSVLVGQQEGTSNYSNVLTTLNNELLTNTLAANRKCRASYNQAAVAADTYVVMVDLDDTVNYPHSQTGGIEIDHFSGSINFVTNGGNAVIGLGVITAIDSSDASISYLIGDVVGVQQANETVILHRNYQPSSVSFKVSGGSLVGAVTNNVEGTNAVNTATTLSSSRGVSITPAVGDVILKLDHDSVNFDVYANILYHSID